MEINSEISKTNTLNKRDLFSNKFGFVISCVGAALGINNGIERLNKIIMPLLLGLWL